MSKAKPTSSVKRAAIKEDLTIIRDLISTVRDQMPEIDKDMPTTANARRAIRKAIMKSLAVWRTMLEHSELDQAIKKHRTDAIDVMMRYIIQMLKAPIDEDGGESGISWEA